MLNVFLGFFLFPLKFYFISVDLLTKTAEQLVHSGIRPSTRLVYDSVQKQYNSFCSNHGLEAIPATENTLLLYVAYLHIRRLKASSIRVYMSAIRSLHVEHGYGDPTEHALRVKLAIRAIEIDPPPPNSKAPNNLAHTSENISSYIT